MKQSSNPKSSWIYVSSNDFADKYLKNHEAIWEVLVDEVWKHCPIAEFDFIAFQSNKNNICNNAISTPGMQFRYKPSC